MQPRLLEPALNVPEGFEYRAGFVTAADEQLLARRIERLAFSRVEMHGGVARRRTAHFGWTYGYTSRSASPGDPIPGFLLDLRANASMWAGIEPEAFVEALVTEYPPGAPIGWHRDAPMFGDIAGISLLSGCRMKFRPYVSPRDLAQARRPQRRTTHEVELAPRSVYLIRGGARREFEHHIPAVAALRYSITFRTARREPMKA